MSVSIRDVAKACGVSTYTVSSVINDKGRVSEATRSRVLAVIKDLGYDATLNAPHLRSNKLKRIGLVMPFGDAPSSSFYFRALVAAKGASAAAELELTVYTEQEIEEYIKQATPAARMHLQSDALIYFAPKSPWQETISTLREWNIPVAIVRRHTRIPGVYSISDDDFSGANILTEHLIEQGHRCIAMIGLGSGQGPITRNRINGYTTALREHDIPFHQELILPYYQKQKIKNMRERCGQDIQDLREQGFPVTGVVLMNDGLSGHLLGSLQNAGLRVPEDIAIAGYGNEPITSQLYPGITAVNMPIKEMVEQAVNCLVHGEDQPIKSYTFENKLIVRDSTPKLS